MARLHIYPHSEPQQDLHIVADPSALRSLAEAMMSVARTPQGFQRVTLHTSDGHEYTAMIVASISEEEWQTVMPAYKGATLPKLEILEDYETVRRELLERKTE